ncbi:MAG: DNA polymerase III subunit beta [Bacteroidota bacterium]
MKFIVSSNSLSRQLQILSGVLNTNNTLPILDDFLFEVNNTELKISASDLETTISTKITIESQDTGIIAIPARLLLDTLKTFAEQPLTFLIEENSLGIEIGSDYGKYKLSGHNGEDFPKIPLIESGTLLEIKSSILSRALNKTIFATGNDELRPVMNGVLCELSPENITFVATDAHKLVRYRRTDAKSETVTSFILPKKPLNLLKNILPVEGDIQVKIEYNDSNAFFTFPTHSNTPDAEGAGTQEGSLHTDRVNIELICRLVDGKYPNYEAVIPKDNPNKMIINRIAFLNSVKRVSIFANKTTHQVRLKISGSELNISAEDLDFANEANERLTCQYQGEDIVIGFNSRFLIEMLSNLDTDEINLEMSAPNRAGILTHVNGKNKDEEDILMLVMPVMLNQ